MGLKFANPDPLATSVKVGLKPSQGSGLVELDSDMLGVFKVDDANLATQKFVVESTNATYGMKTTQEFSLADLTLET